MQDITVSIILCAYQRYKDLIEAIESLRRQTYSNFEVIVVVDGNRELYDRVLNSGVEIDKIILNEVNLGLSESRNRGIKVAEGEIIAFFDDDAIADPEWLGELVKMYEEHDAIAAGGKLLPLWLKKKPIFLPEEYYWLIGATHRGFPEEVCEVRNTFGSNISFRSDVIKSMGGFRSEMGLRGGGQLQGEETEFCERMQDKFGKGVIYNPDAIVYHKIFPERLRMRFLLRRAFWQGYSKQMMRGMGYLIEEERGYLKQLLFKSVPSKLKRGKVGELGFILVCTASVGLGYLYGYIDQRRG